MLISSTALALTGGDLPQGVTVRDLGEHHLRDLDRPERLHQLVIDGLNQEFAEPNTIGRHAGQSLRVVLADDSVLLREGVARILEEADFDVVGQVDNADDLLRRIGFSKPDVAIVDIRMPPTHTDEGLQAAARIRERFPGVGVLVLSSYVEPAYAVELLSESAEGIGYLLKDRVADVDEFADAVRRVAQGGSALDPAVVRQLVGRPRGDDPLDQLTPREREVLSLMAEGRSNAGIALHMVVTERAVEKHVTSIFQKLGLPQATEDHRRVLAVLAYLSSRRTGGELAGADPLDHPGGLLADHRSVLELDHRQLALAGQLLDLGPLRPRRPFVLDDLVGHAGVVQRLLHAPARMAADLHEQCRASMQLDRHLRLLSPVSMRARGLEPPRPSPPAPKAGASTKFRHARVN